MPESKEGVGWKRKPGWEVELNKIIMLALVTGVMHFRRLGTAQPVHSGEKHCALYSLELTPGENLKKYLARVNEIETSFLIAVVERILHVLHAVANDGEVVMAVTVSSGYPIEGSS